MADFSQQNPITIRIDLMRNKWVEKVTSPGINFIRWIVQPDELRMVDAFCMLEGSVHGQLPDLFVRFANNLENEGTYDRTLTEEWLTTWENPEARGQLLQNGVKVTWDPEKWKKKLAENKIVSFLDCMDDFAQNIEGFTDQLVVYLIPITYVSEAAWTNWVTDKIEKGIPARIRLMISDIAEHELFEKLRKVKNTIHLLADLNMSKAAREIATGGDPQNPGVQFNTCLFNIGDALAKKSLTDVNYWGKKAIETGNKSKVFNLEVTGGIAYGAALFQLGKYPMAIEKFRAARETAKTGAASGDTGCNPVLLQTFSFEGAVHLRNKDFKEAMAVYREMATNANEQKNYIMAVDGWYMASYAAKKINKNDGSYAYLQNGFEAALMLGPESIKYSSMLLLSENLFMESTNRKNITLAEKVDAELKTHWGENWKEIAKENKKNQKEYGKGSSYLNFDFLKFK